MPQLDVTTQPSTLPNPLSNSDVADASEKLSKTSLFRRCSPDEITNVAKSMHKVAFSRGDVLVAQNQNADRMLIMAEGHARRLRKGRDGVERHIGTTRDGSVISDLSITSGGPVYATAKCVTQTCSAYSMTRAAFRYQLRNHPQLATHVVEGLSDDLRHMTRLFRTPLLSQRTQDINYSAVTVAAVTESYYRSALNSVLNKRLSGMSSPLFPNMHVQVPTRVLYITGFKGLRTLFDREVDPDKWGSHASRVGVRFANMIAPGIVMTPVSSILEACNVGHANTEPLQRRFLRGMGPRFGREIIFGVGLNQLSDYFEERYRGYSINAIVANMAGSLSAGVVAGYMSHVPHNLSTYKLLNPRKNYSELFKMFVDKSVPSNLIPKTLPPSMLPFTKAMLACLFPRGIIVRTIQVCGSFAILNSLIQLIEIDNRRRMGPNTSTIPGELVAEEGSTIATPQIE